MSKFAAKIKFSPVNSPRYDLAVVAVSLLLASLKRFCVADYNGRHWSAALRPGDRPPVERGTRFERNANAALGRPTGSVNKLLAPSID